MTQIRGAKNLAREIDERIKKMAAGEKPAAKPPAQSLLGAPPDEGGENFDFGVLSIGKAGGESALAGDVKLAEGAGIEIGADDESNSLSVSLGGRERELLSDAHGEIYALCGEDADEDVIAVFRTMNGRGVYALTESAILKLDAEAGELVQIEGAAPGDGETFACVRVYAGCAFIGTRKTGTGTLKIYRFDGESLETDMSLTAESEDEAVTALAVCGGQLFAMAGDLTGSPKGWRVLRRGGALAWQALVPMQTGHLPGALAGSSELIAAGLSGSTSRVFSLKLAVSQIAPAPVLDTPGTSQLSFSGSAEAVSFYGGVFVAEVSQGKIYAVTDATPKVWSGGAALDAAGLILESAAFSKPESASTITSAQVALGCMAAGTFVFGARAEFALSPAGSETWHYLLAYSGGEVVELAAGEETSLPYLKPMCVSPDGELLMAALDMANAKKIFGMKLPLIYLSVYSG